MTPSSAPGATPLPEPRARRPLLMITELFLPTKGGTAVMFDGDCRRLGGKEVHIVTAAVPGDGPFDADNPNTVHRLVLERRPWLRPESLVMYLRLLGRSLALAARHRFGSVLAGRALPEGLVAWIVGRLRGCIVVVYAHGEELTGWGRGWKFRAMCFVLQRADRVLANSDFTRDTLIDLIGVRADRIAMVYPTVDTDRFRPGLPSEDLRALLGLGPAQRLILSVGRLQRRKGFDQVVRALSSLLARGIDAHYALVGIGEDREHLLDLARTAGVAERVHLLGHVEQADLPRWYNASDVFAMPNRDIGGDTEGFGIVYLEANACGRPVLAGRAGGTGSAVEHGVNGLRVDGEDVDAVGAALAQLLARGEAAQQMALAARRRVEERFTTEHRMELIRRATGSETRPADAGQLRILMYTAYLAPEYSGAALQALTLARALRDRGHHVEFVTNRWPGLPDRAVIQGFAVQRLESGRLRKHREFRLWFNLARYLWARRRDFDIVHSHGAYLTHAFVGPLAQGLGLRSLVKVSLANDDLADLSQPRVGGLHRWMLRRVSAAVGTSLDLVHELEGAGVDPARIFHIPNGVDTGRFRPAAAADRRALREQLALPADRPIVLYVGVLDARKNIRWLAEQWVARSGFGSGALLLAVGPQGRDDVGGVLREGLSNLVRQHPKHFLLHDFHADVTPYFQCADVLVLPSRKEGLPNVVLEAMASGLPCVAADASGNRELIELGETGYTYPPDDAEAMGEAVRLCLSARGPTMGRAARRAVERRFSIDAVCKAYEIMYRGLLPQRGPGQGSAEAGVGLEPGVQQHQGPDPEA
jgi:glycosyltransferase involved in cell wall biosynthesis